MEFFAEIVNDFQALTIFVNKLDHSYSARFEPNRYLTFQN